jgi:hypothetical protein
MIGRFLAAIALAAFVTFSNEIVRLRQASI